MNHQADARDVVILSGARTPTGRFQGALSSLSATDLGGAAIEAALAKANVDGASVYEVIMGNVVSAGVGQAPARQAAIKGGLPDSVGGSAVNKVCGSGLKAVMIAANGIKAGEGDVYVAGGMESMSGAPYLAPKMRAGARYGHAAMEDSLVTDGLWCAFQNWAMGNAAEFIAKQFEVSRAEMDAFALESHRRAAEATVTGRFANEIAPVTVTHRRGASIVAQDEPIRASFDNGGFAMQTSLEKLGRLPAVFEEGGAVTAGNAPGLNDGAAAIVLSSRAAAEANGNQPIARIVGYTHAAVDPQWIFAAPARAIPKLLDRVGWEIGDVDLFEINEAFAAQVLANCAELHQRGYPIDLDRVNVNGGAVALGHPIGCSGGRVLVTLMHALQQRQLRKGIATLCLGGGEAVAMAIEIE